MFTCNDAQQVHGPALNRFEFSVSLEEAKSRKLDVAVKNNRMFYVRERKEIGTVS